MAQDSDWKKGEHLDEFNSIAAKAAAFAANNPQLQGKAAFGTSEPEKPAVGDKNNPGTWKVEGSAGSMERESRSEAIANRQLAASAKKGGPGGM